MSFMRSSSLQYPRPKIYLSSLSQLIDRRVTLQPQIEVNNKLFPQRNFAKKLSITHQRIKSSVQLRSQKVDLLGSDKKVKNLVVQNNRPTTKDHIVHDNPFPRTKSTELVPVAFNINHTRSQLRYTQSEFAVGHNVQTELSEERLQSPQKNFLRKGSNLQKQIVINLLRNKLIREQERSVKKQYSNQQIIKMIEVYKGVALLDGKRKGIITEELTPSSASPKKTKKHDHMREIRGWQHEPLHQFEHQDKQ